MIQGDGFRLRRAEPEDADFLAGLLTHEDVEPYMAAVRPGLLEQIERSQAEPQDYGLFVVEVEDDGAWRPAGTMGFEVANRRSRIAQLGGLAVDPGFRGRGLADEAARLL